jgi:hypothetical protein
MRDRYIFILVIIALFTVSSILFLPLLPAFGTDRVISTIVFNGLVMSLFPISWQLKRRMSLQSPWRRALFQISMLILGFVVVSWLIMLLNPLIGPITW